MRYTIIALLFVSCSYQSDSSAVVHKDISLAKQKSRIASLEKKLEEAVKGVLKAKDEVARFQGEVQEARLLLISKQIDAYEEQIEEFLTDPTNYSTLFHADMGDLFLKEREELEALISSGAPLQAQALLDRILRLITQLSDDNMAIQGL